MRKPDAEALAQLAIRENVSEAHADFGRYAALTAAVFESAPIPHWPALGAYDAAGHCVAGLQQAVLLLWAGGATMRCAALGNVVVAAEWRGRGLMTHLFASALARADAVADIGLLYAKTPAIYARIGFAALPQHAFEGRAPAPEGAATARPVELARDRRLLDRLLRSRAPLSTHVWMVDDAGLTLRALCSGARLLFYDPSLDAAILVERDGDCLVLADIVAPVMPPAARILGALGLRPSRLRTLFPPDQIGWNGSPTFEDAGLMIRGPVPSALRRPFILPPTVEF